MRRSAKGEGSWLDVGLDRDAHIPQVGGWDGGWAGGLHPPTHLWMGA